MATGQPHNRKRSRIETTNFQRLQPDFARTGDADTVKDLVENGANPFKTLHPCRQHFPGKAYQKLNADNNRIGSKRRTSRMTAPLKYEASNPNGYTVPPFRGRNHVTTVQQSPSGRAWTQEERPGDYSASGPEEPRGTSPNTEDQSLNNYPFMFRLPIPELKVDPPPPGNISSKEIPPGGPRIWVYSFSGIEELRDTPPYTENPNWDDLNFDALNLDAGDNETGDNEAGSPTIDRVRHQNRNWGFSEVASTSPVSMRVPQPGRHQFRCSDNSHGRTSWRGVDDTTINA
ncbi:hypothetical protein MAC_05841 [Metarhizium acridum CQMa 102]|uniref:Uncharacterized protein n=1 Tax=Metarhizium acridum (strain CQMa 102) TaxID=655827 RepID=E9E7J3_METAQ|nr:uncharacterized protein MAC_05841 [Metarhizium acridum CQMa 102]EFY88103.1 hypothetical protein MAC_05841 [Metarhizium acridum CQMa 102]